MGYVKKQHRCPLPVVEGSGDIWQCDQCGRTWRSKAFGNPMYNTWHRVLGRRQLWRPKQ